MLFCHYLRSLPMSKYRLWPHAGSAAQHAPKGKEAPWVLWSRQRRLQKNEINFFPAKFVVCFYLHCWTRSASLSSWNGNAEGLERNTAALELSLARILRQKQISMNTLLLYNLMSGSILGKKLWTWKERFWLSLINAPRRGPIRLRQSPDACVSSRVSIDEE